MPEHGRNGTQVPAEYVTARPDPGSPRRKDHEYTHLFAGEVESVAEEESIAERPSGVTHRIEKMTHLEARIDRLERALVDLAERLGDPIDFDDAEDETRSGT